MAFATWVQSDRSVNDVVVEYIATAFLACPLSSVVKTTTEMCMDARTDLDILLLDFRIEVEKLKQATTFEKMRIASRLKVVIKIN